MKEDLKTIFFSLATSIYFKLGDSIDNGFFEITDIQKCIYNSSTGGHDYELTFNAYYWKWNNKIFKYTPETGGQEASWNLTATLDTHLGIFLRNLKALGYKYSGQDFVFSIDSTVENKSELVSYDSTYMIDALSLMAEKWKCEWWVTDNVIHFGRCEFGEAITFNPDNIEDMTREESSQSKTTRIYAFGSTNNIPTSYRPVDESLVVNGVVQRRLMLPVGTPCIDVEEGLTEEQAIEGIIVNEEIFPRFINPITAVSTKEYTDTIENENGTETIEKWNAYRFTDTSIKFSKDYLISGQTLKVKFDSGKLNGLEFEVSFNPTTGGISQPEKNEDGSWNINAQIFEVVRNEDYGRKLPDTVLYPQAGDKYVLTGFDTSFVADNLVSQAEEELKTWAQKYVAKLNIDSSNYRCKHIADENLDLYEVGQRVTLVNPAFFETSRASRIIGFEYPLDIPYDHPIYTCGESPSYSRLGNLENKIESLTYKSQTYAQSNIERALKEYRSSLSGLSTISSDIKVNAQQVGYYRTGDVILSGTTIEKVIKNMLYKASGAELKGTISTSNDVEFGSAKGVITYQAVKNGNGDITKAYYDNNEANILTFGAEMNGIRTATRQLQGNYTQNETYSAKVTFARGTDCAEVTLENRISVNVRRKWFAGVVSSIPTTSAEVRALLSSGLYTGAGTYKFSAGIWKMIVICIPTGTIQEISVTAYPGNFIEDGGVCSGPTVVSVDGANGSEAQNYNMWIIKAETNNDADTFTFKTT